MRVFALLLHGGVLGGGPGSHAFTPVLAKRSRAAEIPHDRAGGTDSRRIGCPLRVATTTAVAGVSEEELSQMTVAELKERLRALRLAVGGRKTELIGRLHDHYSTTSAREEEPDRGAEVESSDTSSEQDALPPTIEALQSLTVPILKARLKKLGCPVGGRKVELIERLAAAMEDHADSDSDDDALTMGNMDDLESASVMENEIESPLYSGQGDNLDGVDGDKEKKTLDESIDNGDTDDSDSSSLVNILDDILGTDEEDGEEGDKEIFDESIDGKGDGSGFKRRLRRKKYWKSQDVRELIRANDPRAAAEAEQMITTLETMAEKKDDAEYLPGPEEYTLLVEAYAKSGTAEALRKAEAVIERVLDERADEGAGRAVPPTAPLLNAMIAAYATVGDVGAAQKATTILERMGRAKQSGGTLRPTVHSYAIAISAWAKCASEIAAEEAEVILRQLLDDHKEALKSEGPDGYAVKVRPNNIVLNRSVVYLLGTLCTISRSLTYN